MVTWLWGAGTSPAYLHFPPAPSQADLGVFVSDVTPSSWDTIWHIVGAQSISKYILFYWNIVDLPRGFNFCCTAKRFSYTYTHILFHILFHYGLSQDIEYSFPVLRSRTLLLMHSRYTGLHLLIPDSQSIIHRQPSVPLGNYKSVLCVCESVS